MADMDGDRELATGMRADGMRGTAVAFQKLAGPSVRMRREEGAVLPNDEPSVREPAEDTVGFIALEAGGRVAAQAAVRSADEPEPPKEVDIDPERVAVRARQGDPLS